jgi:hypothetical protein
LLSTGWLAKDPHLPKSILLSSLFFSKSAALCARFAWRTFSMPIRTGAKGTLTMSKLFDLMLRFGCKLAHLFLQHVKLWD